ncbi:hypothetical protein B5X24_HaOG211961 [Helicoverpa armigera]|uniref:BED-type domain-containing protein n=1 Tax=Helicoverpa armigera TaxID=29058 RepID=A0A2W1BEB1_HELAM|nr:hypothetical protein B5X24_HaOG211961 [Helicoverpa armigera]
MSNLAKHFRTKHSDVELIQTKRYLSNSDSDGEPEKPFTKKKKSTWNYYEVLDSDKFEATCKLCSADIHYDSVSDLAKHIREEHGEEPSDSDDDYEPVQEGSNEPIPSDGYDAMHCGPITALPPPPRLTSYHKRNPINYFCADTKKLIISSNGQLFELDTDSSKIQLDADDKEPLEMDTIYLEDLDDSLDQIPPPRRISNSSPKKKPTVPQKRNFASIAKEPVNIRTDETDELLMLTGVWSYFEAEGKKARCELCGTSLPDDYEELKSHLGEHHPETLLDIMRKKEQREKAERSDNDDGQDQDNMTFTEIVYLEQDTSDSTDSIPVKPKPKPSPKTVKIKTVKRRESTLTSDDIPMKRQKNCQSDVDNNELDAFIKYVTCLLKKLPANVFSEVQGEIISCIMKANSRIRQPSVSLSSQSVSLNKDTGVNNANNLVTVREITPVNNALGHNFSIVVAPKETDSGT